MYENVSCCVRSGHDYTEFFESPAGVKQGCLLGPKMFCLFINEVTDEIRKAGRHGILLSNLTEEIFTLLFAVDIALVEHTPAKLQNQLNVLARASAKILLQVNLDKTKVTVFRKRGTLQKNGS